MKKFLFLMIGLLAALLVLQSTPFKSSFSIVSDTVLLTPGSKWIDGSLVKNYERDYTIYKVNDGNKQPVGSIHDEYLHVNKKHALRLAKIKFGTNTILDSGLCESATLKPIYHKSHQGTRRMSFDFSEDRITGDVLKTNGPDTSNEKVSQKFSSVLFDSYYEDILVQCIKYKPGLKFKFPEYIYERGGEVWSLGEVVGTQLLKEHDIWIVKFYELSNERKIVRTTTYNIDAHDRSIISREYDMNTVKIIMDKN